MSGNTTHTEETKADAAAAAAATATATAAAAAATATERCAGTSRREVSDSVYPSTDGSGDLHVKSGRSKNDRNSRNHRNPQDSQNPQKSHTVFVGLRIPEDLHSRIYRAKARLELESGKFYGMGRLLEKIIRRGLTQIEYKMGLSESGSVQ